MNIRRHNYRRSRAGFSLVEVALAVAIAALGIITCLGLLPEGLEMSRKTTLLTINRNIAEQIIRDLENVSTWSVLKPNTKLPKLSSTTSGSGGSGGAGGSPMLFYYDDQGAKVESGADNITFVAMANVTGAAYLPGSTSDEPYLARIVIRVANTTNSDFQFPVDDTQDAQNDSKHATFHHLVAKSR